MVDLSTPEVETPEVVAGRILRALEHIEPERIIVAPDCGMKSMARDTAFNKLKAMVKGADLARARL